jgi:hypothetical protein
MRIIKKTEGAISIFLCIILLAMMVLASVLVEGTRVKSAATQIDSALDSSVKSALANYNYLLKELYGLMALSGDDPELLKDEIAYYLERTLMIADTNENDAESESLWNAINDSKTGSSVLDFFGFSDNGLPPLDLYDYGIEKLKVQPLYNLSEPEVLRAQILEYMKYRAPKQLAEGLMDKFLTFKDFKKQSDVLSKKMDVDKKLTDIKEKQITASDNMVTVNKFSTDFNLPNQLEIAAGYILGRIKIEKELENQKSRLKGVEDEIEEYEDEIEELKKEIERKKKEAQEKDKEDSESDDSADASEGGKTENPAKTDTSEETRRIDELMALIEDLEDSIPGLKSDIENSEKDLKTKKTQITQIESALLNYLEKTVNAAQKSKSALVGIRDESKQTVKMIDGIGEELKRETNEFSNTVRVDLGGKKEKISTEDLNPKIQQVEQNISILKDLESYIHNAKLDELGLSDFDGRVPDIDEIRDRLSIGLIMNKIGEYNGKANGIPIDYYEDKGIISDRPKDGEKDPRDAIKDFIENGGPKDQKEIKENEKKMPDDVPSKKGYEVTSFEEITKDKEYIDSVLKIIASQDYYTTQRLSGDIKDLTNIDLKDASFSGSDTSFSKNGLSIISQFSDMFVDGLYNMRDEIFIDEYIMGNFANYTTDMEKDLDLRGQLMKDRPVFFDTNNSDVEYVLWGSENESTNVLAVKAQITLVRFALNTIAIYTDSTKYNAALQVATVVAGWTAIGVPIVHTLVMMAWAMAESLFDTYYLLKGESIPIFKTRNTWITDLDGLTKTITDEFINQTKEHAKTAISNAIDYTENEVESFLDKAGTTLWDYIDSKIDLLVDKAFVNIENPFSEETYSADNIFEDVEDTLVVKVDGDLGEIMKKIGSEAHDLLVERMGEVEKGTLESFFPDEIRGVDYTDVFNQYRGRNFKEAIAELSSIVSQGEALPGLNVDETSKKINSLIFNTLQDAKNKVKFSIKEKIMGYKSGLIESFKESLQKTADKGKEEVDKFIDSLGNTEDSKAMKTNLKASFLSMKYTDYLRLFLLLVDSDKKVERVADLIQMNMRKASGKDSFKMSDCSTYMRVESEVSIKYLFLSKPFIPEALRTEDGKRIKLDTVLYKGY